MSTETLEAEATRGTPVERGATGAVEHPETETETTSTAEATRPQTTQDLESSLKKWLDGEETPQAQTGDEPAQVTAAEAEKTLDETPDPEKAEEAERTQWPESAQKRVDKLTAQKHELKTAKEMLEGELTAQKQRVSELETQVQAGPQQQATATAPLGFIDSPQKLAEFTTGVKANARAIEDYLDGALEGEPLDKFMAFAKTQGAVNEHGEVNTAKLKQLKRTAQDVLTEYVPQRLEFLKAEAHNSAKADERWTWLKDKTSAEHKRFDQVVANMPSIKSLPHWKAVAAIYVRGLMAEEADLAKETAAKTGKTAAATTAPKRQPVAPKLPGAATAAPRQASTTQTSTAALREKAYRTRDPRDFEALVKAELEATNKN